MSEEARQSLLETLCNVEITRLSRSELRDLGARKKHEREYKRYNVGGGGGGESNVLQKAKDKSQTILLVM